MTKLQPHNTVVLNPGYRLRDDIHRVALFAKAGEGDYSPEWHTFMHPQHSLIFSFFTHNRPYAENVQLLSDYFHRPPDEVATMVDGFINNPQPICVQLGADRVYFPRNVLTDLKENVQPYHFSRIEPLRKTSKQFDLQTRRFYTGPLLVTFMLTNRCRTDCVYCYADTTTRVSQHLSTQRILELIREAAALPVRSINLMGGEIFVHPDWDVILSELVRLDIAPDFLSTKIPITSEILTRLLATGYRNTVQVSLDACQSNILKQTLHVGESYLENMQQGIRLLDASGIPYQVSTVLTTLNCNTDLLDGLFSFLTTLPALRDWRINPVSNSITKSYNEFSRLKPQRVQIESVFNYTVEVLQPESPFPIRLNRDLLDKEFYTCEGGSTNFCGSECSALNTHVFILPDGKATICEQMYWDPRFVIGDVTHSSLVDVWNSPRALQLANLAREDIQEESACKGCSLFAQCFGYRNRCWSDIIKAYGPTRWDFPDPRCNMAPPMDNHLGY